MSGCRSRVAFSDSFMLQWLDVDSGATGLAQLTVAVSTMAVSLSEAIEHLCGLSFSHCPFGIVAVISALDAVTALVSVIRAGRHVQSFHGLAYCRYRCRCFVAPSIWFLGNRGFLNLLIMFLFSAPIRCQFKSEWVLVLGIITHWHGVPENSDSLEAEQAADFIGLYAHQLLASVPL